jgi:regulator of replication initiation timing
MSGEQRQADFSLPTWRQPDGEPLSCVEKIKVLNENLEEIREMVQDALEDGILMGCDEKQLREVLQALVASLDNPYGKKD